MSGENQVTPIAGPISASAGVVLLPNTGGSTILAVLGIIMIACGVIVMASFVVTKISSRLIR